MQASFLISLITAFKDTLPDLIANGTTAADWVYVRTTQNHFSNAPVRSR